MTHTYQQQENPQNSTINSYGISPIYPYLFLPSIVELIFIHFLLLFILVFPPIVFTRTKPRKGDQEEKWNTPTNNKNVLSNQH